MQILILKILANLSSYNTSSRKSAFIYDNFVIVLATTRRSNHSRKELYDLIRCQNAIAYLENTSCAFDVYFYKCSSSDKCALYIYLDFSYLKFFGITSRILLRDIYKTYFNLFLFILPKQKFLNFRKFFNIVNLKKGLF